MRNLLQGGFSGPITPVNPKYRKVAGVRAFPSVARLIRYCRARGIGELFGEVLSGNERMLALAEDLGFEIHHRPDPQTFRVCLKLQPD